MLEDSNICYVAIDPSITGTGVALQYGIETKTLFIPTKKDPELPHEEDILLRSDYISSEIIRFITSFSQLPDKYITFMEGYALGGKGRVFDIAEVVGLIKYRLWFNLHSELIIVTPTELKKFTTGSGDPISKIRRKLPKSRRPKESKKAMINAVYEVYGQYFENDNLCDSYALLQLGLAFLGKRSILTKEQRSVIDSISERYNG